MNGHDDGCNTVDHAAEQETPVEEGRVLMETNSVRNPTTHGGEMILVDDGPAEVGNAV